MFSIFLVFYVLQIYDTICIFLYAESNPLKTI